jgi:hypothetical protein
MDACKRLAEDGTHRAGDECRQHWLRNPAGSEISHGVRFNVKHSSFIDVVWDRPLGSDGLCDFSVGAVANLLGEAIKHLITP